MPIRHPARALPSLALLLTAAAVSSVAACGPHGRASEVDAPEVRKTSGAERAARRLYDGAPPVIPHHEFGAACSTCHDSDGLPVEGLGFASASPHEETSEIGATVRCRQCHVPVLVSELFVETGFKGLEQDLIPGSRLYDGAPPTIPHSILMRENCAACHVGPGARQEITTTHPERTRCRQCHVPITTREGILSYPEAGSNSSEGS